MSSSSRLLPLSCALILSGILCSVTPLPAPALDMSVVVRSTEPGQVEAEPAGIATTSFLIDNRSSKSVEVLEEIDLPEGWKLITSESRIELGPGETRLRLVSFHVPQTARAGSYTVSYEVKDLASYFTVGLGEATVAVLPVTGLSVVFCEAPSRVVAGDTLRTRLEIRNDGNLGSTIHVRVTSSESYSVRPGAVTLNIGAGRSRTLTVEVAAPSDIERKITHVLTAEAHTASPVNGREAARSTTAHEILPRGTGLFDPYHRVASTLRTAYVGGAGRSGVQLEYSGGGPLAEGGDVETDFLIRAPDARGSSVFGLREEYRLRFVGTNYRLKLGDAVYDLSPLTSWRRYGRGLGVGLDLGRWTLGGSYLKTRWGGPRANEGTAHVAYRHGDRLELGLNYLARGQNGASGVLSTSAAAQPLRSVDLELEYAFAPGGRDHDAYRARVQGVRGDARCVFERIRAGKSYVGLHKNEIQTTGSVSLPAGWGLRLRAFYRDYERGCGGDAGAVSWTDERVASLGLKRALPLGMRAAVEYWDLRRSGWTCASVYDYETRTFKVGLERPHPTVSARCSVELGVLEDVLECSEHDVRRYGFRLNYNPNSCCRVSGHFQSALSGCGDPTMRSDVAGVRLELAPSGDLGLDLGFQRRGYSEDAGAEVDEFTAGAGYTLPSGHRVSGRLRRTWSEAYGQDETIFQVAYDVLIGVRGGRKTSVGCLRGTVYDAEDPHRCGLEGVAVLLNDLGVVTDERGDFAFPSLAPGEYQLAIDQRSIGLDRVATKRLPLGIEVFGGSEAEVELGVATAGCVEGEVVADGVLSACVGGPSEAGGEALAQLIVELASPGETLKCMTDRMGRFVFRGIRPGQWVLTVCPEGLPRHSELAEESYPVVVLPGATCRVVAEIVPVPRDIPIVDEGEVRVSAYTP